MQGSKQTRDMFLTRALQRILEDREIKRSYNSELRQECKKTLGKLFKVEELFNKSIKALNNLV